MPQPTTRSMLPETGALPDFAPYLLDAEERHFWFRARNTVIGRVVGQLVSRLPQGYRVLEVGCGNGNVLRMLEQVCTRGEVIGMDIVDEKLHFARQRTECELRRGSLFDLPEDEAFDVIGMFDVLEHLPDDIGALCALRRALPPGGRLVLTVPAHTSLWSYADTHAGHFRRYSVSQLRRALTRSGFRVEYCTQFMTTLYPLLWLGRRLASLRRGSNSGLQRDRDLFARELRVVPGINGLLRRVLEFEAPLIARRYSLPIGTSLLAVAEKA